MGNQVNYCQKPPFITGKQAKHSSQMASNNRLIHKKQIYSSRHLPQTQQIHIDFFQTQNAHELAQTFNLFINDPYNYFREVSVVQSSSKCCKSNLIRIQSYLYKKITMDNLLTMKRMKHLRFTESEVWYILKCTVSVFGYMSSKGLVYGCISPGKFFLKEGKFFKIDILHFLNAKNKNFNELNSQNYYSPQFISLIKEGNIPIDKSYQALTNQLKSQIFAFGLFILEVCTCPEPHPKFYKYNFKQFIWSQVLKRLQMMGEHYSQKLVWIVGTMLRQQRWMRPDWNYLKVCIKRQQQNGTIEIAPCIFWSM